MIAFAFILLALQAAPEAPDAGPAQSPEAQELIVVYGERAKDWKGRYRSKDGAFVCKTTKSTGDEAIDDIRCNAMVQCLDPVADQYQALQDSDLKRKEKREQLNVLLNAQVPCMIEYFDNQIALLAEQRAQ